MKTPRENGDGPKVEPRGPAVWENWKAALAGREFPGAYEVPLYTDAHIRGHLEHGYGPYQLLCTCVYETAGLARPEIMLRAEAELGYTSDELKSSDLSSDKRYHGGGLDDEVAALFSLSLGIRLKPGERSRTFDPGGDPKGVPRFLFCEEPVLLTRARARAHGRVIPGAVREQSLNDDTLVKYLPLLAPGDAFAVVRAARLYQDGLWIAESQPALAWLMFVSAIETAANHWRSAKETPRERLHASKADLEELLVAVGDQDHANEVAEMIADSLGSTQKFTDFVLEFLPARPPYSGPEWQQCSWDPPNMEAAMKTIYSHRSRALHDGTPFPLPMCEPPFPGPAERPVGLSVSLPLAGVKWEPQDLPMHLHTFEYIVQGALCKWWKDMVERRTDTAGGGCAT